MIQTVFSAELPVGEHLLIQKHTIVGTAPAPFGGEAAADGHRPRSAVVTGGHGDELEGQYVAFRLAQLLEENLDALYGTVDIYPAINPLGINSIERSVPMFDVDLNRTFPGKAAGDLTETLAAAVIGDISGADAAIGPRPLGRVPACAQSPGTHTRRARPFASTASITCTGMP